MPVFTTAMQSDWGFPMCCRPDPPHSTETGFSWSIRGITEIPSRTCHSAAADRSLTTSPAVCFAAGLVLLFFMADTPAAQSPHRGKPRAKNLRLLAAAGVLAIAATIYLNRASARWIPEADARVKAAETELERARIAGIQRRAKENPADPAAQLEFGRTLVDRSLFVPALIPAEKAVQLAPSSADAHLFLAMVCTTLDYRSEALANYRRAIEL